MHSRPDADVVICSWAGDSRPLTLATLSAVAGQAESGRVHLVDMSPTRDLAERAEGVPGVVVHWRPDSSGLGESRQAGLTAAGGRFVAFLDSDAVPRPGWLAALRAGAEEPDVAVAGGPVLPVWPRDRRRPPLFRTNAAGDFLSMLNLGDERRDVPRVLPGNMLIDRSLTGRQAFTEAFGRSRGDLRGAEEIAMMLRVRHDGHRIVYVPTAVVDHHTAAERMSWRWLWRRGHAAGREAALHGVALEPLPRRRTLGDRAVKVLLAPAFLHGRYVASRR